MSRRVNRAETETLLAKLRGSIPNLTLRTTFITGFPGETDAHYAELEQFVVEQRFERLGVFTYSFEPDTPAALLPEQIPHEVKEERRDRLMAVQQPIAFETAQAKIGRTIDVLLDQPVAGQRQAWVGRTVADAPDVDAVAYVTCPDQRPKAGQIVPCEIVATREYDLIAVAVGQPH